MHIYENEIYQEDLKSIIESDLPWNMLQNASVLITGGTGMIGSVLIDAIMLRNKQKNMCCTVCAAGRNRERAEERFKQWQDNPYFRFIEYDVNVPLVQEDMKKIDYILHLASNTHPLAYATDPIGTITTNIIGLKNLLDFAVDHETKRFAFASSNEIYGENRGDVEKFEETYCGYIDCNTMRAGYPESKRCGEALCQAYKVQKNLDIVIPRLTRSYGPTLLKSDTKALSQFLHKGIAGENIVLKSAGTQFYSYTYAADAVTGLLTVLLKGKSGEAYNIASEASDIMLKDLASTIADICGVQVVFDVPDELEAAGYSRATKARLDSSKLEMLGWTAKNSINEGLRRTLAVMKKLYI